MKNLTISLAQINNSFSEQNYLPYSIALLESYVIKNSKRPEYYNFNNYIYKRMPIHEIVEKMSGADVVGFSMYVWNEQITLESIRRIKKINNKILIIVGGPQIPSLPNEFFNKNKDIDIVVHNEGEATFLDILENYENLNLHEINGISFIKNGKVITNKPRERIKDLSYIPSPFLNGIFDKVISNNPSENWISLWETNRGCPFKCTFCDWGSATASKVTKFNIDRLKQELDWMINKKINYIFVCDANYGMQQQDIEIAKYVAELKIKTGYPQGFSVQNTKNATERAYQTQKIISDSGLNKGVALSMQSLDKTTLQNIKRDNISLETYFELSKRFAAEKVDTYSDLIIGLPGETYSTFKSGVQKLLDMGQHSRIQFNNLSILPNAEMGQISYLQKYGMKSIVSKVINIHGEKNEIEDDVDELQTLIIATNSMPHDMWIRTRVFSWAMNFFYFNKILQIPIIITSIITNKGIVDIIEELIMNKDKKSTLQNIISVFEMEASKIQNGGYEYKFSSEWLSIYWPVDEYIYIDLVVNNKLNEFYDDCFDILLKFYGSEQINYLISAIDFNKNVISNYKKEGTFNFKYDLKIVELCEDFKKGLRINIDDYNAEVSYSISHKKFSDLSQWCREVVWWGNKKGAYLANINNSNFNQSIELDGHY
jgi:radical SAM superfamily enzyme YgiQ (UPF0313 family)